MQRADRRNFGVTGTGCWVICCWEDAAFEHWREGVEGLLPAHGPSLSALAGRVECSDGEVEAFQRGLLVWGSAREHARPVGTGLNPRSNHCEPCQVLVIRPSKGLAKNEHEPELATAAPSPLQHKTN